MGNPIEDVKGRAKEAAGAVTGSDSLRREGQAQQEKSDAQERAAQHENKADAERARAADAEVDERRNQ
jgi:uncharacterized protein YjbJ (UPF0337 family)